MSTPEPPLPDPKRVTRTVEAIPSVPFYLNSSMNMVVGLVVAGVAGISLTFCRLGLKCFEFSAEKWTPGIVGVYTIIAASVWGYKRWKQGRDPKNPLPTLTVK